MNSPATSTQRGAHSLLRLWDKASLYLPVMLMGILSLGTYWLARNTPVNVAPEVARELVHEADYFMRNFTVKNFDEKGRLRSQLSGVEARHFPDTDTLEIDQGRIRNIDLQGKLTLSSANRVLSNGDGSELQLIGNAVVVREASRNANGEATPRMEYRGEFLHAFVNEERVTSHKPVVLTRGTDQFTGDSFAYDNLSGVGELKGRVRGVLMPRAAPSTSQQPRP